MDISPRWVDLSSELLVSVVVTLIALLVFGALKGRFTGTAPLRSGLQTLLIGGLAARRGLRDRQAHLVKRRDMNNYVR